MPGLFDLIQGAMGRPDPAAQVAMMMDPSARMRAQLSGGPPGAAPGPGGPSPGDGAASGPPTGAAPPAGPQAPPQGPQAYAPDPNLAPMQQQLAQPNLGQMLVQMQQRQQSNEMFNRGMAGVIAGFGRPWNRRNAAELAGVGSTPDPSSTFQNLMTLQGYQQQQQARQDFLASLPDMVEKFKAQGINVTAQELAAGGQPMLQDLIKFGMQANAPTEAAKNAEAAAKAYRAANPGATDSEIAQVKSDILAGAVGPQDPATTAWRSAVRIFHQNNPNQPLPPEMKDPVTFAGFKTQEGKTAALAADEKSTAATGFADVSPTYDLLKKNIAFLKANREATIAAIRNPNLSSGMLGQMVGGYLVGQEALDARNILNTFGNQQFRAGMQNTKNVRTQQEANKIGGSMTSLDNRTNSDKAITDELDRLDTTTTQSYASLKAAAGQPLTAEEKAAADKIYLDPASPYYNYGAGGVTEAKPAPQNGGGGRGNQPVTTVKTPEEGLKLPKGTRFVIPDGSGRIGIAPGG
jgi:alkylhydroperoxidase/carboxymuconolactone decarboxylase family protein YurZ